MTERLKWVSCQAANDLASGADKSKHAPPLPINVCLSLATASFFNHHPVNISSSFTTVAVNFIFIYAHCLLNLINN